MMLTKRERNQIYEAITQGGIDSAEFKFMITEETVVSHENGSKLKIISWLTQMAQYIASMEVS